MGFKSCLGAPALMAHEERILAQMPRSPPEPYPQSGGQAACASGRAHPCYHIPQASLSPGLLWGRASSGVSGGQCCLWLAAPRGSWGVLSALHFLVLALLSRGRSGCDERGSGQNPKKSWLAVKPACSLVEDASLGSRPGLSPGLGRSPGEGKGNPLQYYCLENPMDRGAWWVMVPGVAKSQKPLSTQHYTFS